MRESWIRLWGGWNIGICSVLCLFSQMRYKGLSESLPQTCNVNPRILNITNRGRESDPAAFQEVHCTFGVLKRPVPHVTLRWRIKSKNTTLARSLSQLIAFRLHIHDTIAMHFHRNGWLPFIWARRRPWTQRRYCMLWISLDLRDEPNPGTYPMRNGTAISETVVNSEGLRSTK